MIQFHSFFSLKYGLVSPKELLLTSLKLGFSDFLLADINNTSGCLEFVREAKNLGIRPIIGIDFRNGNQQLYTAIARNNQGFQEMNAYLSYFLHRNEIIPNKAPSFKHVEILYPFDSAPEDLRSFEWVKVEAHQLIHLPFSKWKNRSEKLVAYHHSSFRNKRDFNAHRLLRAIDTNALLSQLPSTEEGKPEDLIEERILIKSRFDSYPFLFEQGEDILKKCTIDFNFDLSDHHNNLQHYTGSEEKDFKMIKKLVYHGIKYRYQEINDAILDRIEKELNVIKEKGFVSYFLIAWRLLVYARNKDYFYVGRGSGANSIVAYLLRITDVDPFELDLYFERFINLFRNSPPDFDLDFSWKDRQDVTQFLFKRFNNVALLATYNTFQYKSTIRELGKVFGLPDFEIKKLQQESKFSDDIGRLILLYSKHIQGNPSHLSVHSAGLIISQKPIHHYTATFFPPKGFPITQFDMYAAEDIGLHKFDILGQRGLAKVKDALTIIEKHHPEAELDIHNIKKIKGDFASNKLLEKGNAVGCFYVESPAMRMLLRKLKVSDYLGLVAASSVIRPGVAQSGMMQEYILRFRNPEQRAMAQKRFPVLYKLMPETFGVMVYQEDVIKVAHHFAGLSLAESDVLRRGMSGKFRSRDEFQSVQSKFFSNCAEKGHSAELVQDVWRQIESFAGYAFAKGHSASYAVESYQCLYLKAYYPIEYMVATINNGGGFYSTELYLHEAKQNGATPMLPCINNSRREFIIQDKKVYIGLARIQSLESDFIQHLLEIRDQDGPFDSLRNFIKRTACTLIQVTLLIRVGAFNFFSTDKKALLWDAHLLLSKTPKKIPQAELFKAPQKSYKLPELWKHRLENAYDEIELLGFPVSISPFDIQKDPLKNKVCIKHLPHFLNQEIEIIGYLVHVKRTQTKNGDRMFFGSFIDQEGEWIDTVHFPIIAQQFPFRGVGCYLIKGKVIEEFDFYTIEVSSMRKLEVENMEG